jgi:hypothetical protein
MPFETHKMEPIPSFTVIADAPSVVQSMMVYAMLGVVDMAVSLPSGSLFSVRRTKVPNSITHSVSLELATDAAFHSSRFVLRSMSTCLAAPSTGSNFNIRLSALQLIGGPRNVSLRFIAVLLFLSSWSFSDLHSKVLYATTLYPVGKVTRRN